MLCCMSELAANMLVLGSSDDRLAAPCEARDCEACVGVLRSPAYGGMFETGDCCSCCCICVKKRESIVLLRTRDGLEQSEHRSVRC